MESEEYNPDNLDLRFDVASVLKELKRGKRLVRSFSLHLVLSQSTEGCLVSLCLGKKNAGKYSLALLRLGKLQI